MTIVGQCLEFAKFAALKQQELDFKPHKEGQALPRPKFLSSSQLRPGAE